MRVDGKEQKMNRLPSTKQLPGRERIELIEQHGAYRAFAVFLVACALLIAAFAISAVWKQADGNPLPDGTETGTFSNAGADTLPEGEPNTEGGSEEAEPEEGIPDGAEKIRDMDLAYRSLGEEYLHNETGYRPNVADLLEKPLSLDLGAAPTVLVLHTHTTEAYLPSGTAYIDEPMGDLSYSEDPEKNVISVGRSFCEALEKKGITVLHCTVMHDDPTLRGSYERAAETIRAYLEDHPEICCVVDLHRDSVRDREGAYIRSLAEGREEPTAQLLCVVGTDGNGTPCEQWEKNLALALQLRHALNANGGSLCRPVSLRNASFNQELAPMSILLEVGCDANAIEEARRAATLAGEALADLLLAN